MSPLIRAQQDRVLAEAQVLNGMAHVPPELRKAQAARVFRELKDLTRVGSDGSQQQQVQRWWLGVDR